MATIFKLNLVSLAGRLTADPKYAEKESESGSVKRCAFRLAVTRKKYKADQEPTTDFISIVAWGKKAEVISKYFRKGDPIFVSGELHTYQYKDKNGAKHEAFEVELSDFTFIESPRAKDVQQPDPTAAPAAEAAEAEDLPWF